MKRVNNYELMEVLGQGEYGKVYRGVDIESGQEVAIKVINRETQEKTPELEGFLRNEQEVLGMTKCEEIVELLQMLRVDQQLYLVYSYCAGGNLEELLALHGPMAEQPALSIFRAVLRAFHHLHQPHRVIIHRDLKPQNILFESKGGKVKLADFGFCKVFQSV